jgi:hypothetical protein
MLLAASRLSKACQLTLQVSFPINGGAINQRTLRGELTREVW